MLSVYWTPGKNRDIFNSTIADASVSATAFATYSYQIGGYWDLVGGVLQNISGLCQIDGVGMPPIQLNEQRVPFSHGAFLRGYAFQTRSLTIGIRRQSVNESAYWQDRSTFIAIFSPLYGMGILSVVFPDNTIKHLDCIFEEELSGIWAGETASYFSFATSLVLKATDPFWRSTLNLQEWNFNEEGGCQGVITPVALPFASNLVGGAPNVDIAGTFCGSADFAVNNLGDWESYPVIRWSGAVNAPTIWNLTANKKVEYTGEVRRGETLIIDGRIGAKTVTVEGQNMFGYFSADSQFWSLAPGWNSLAFGADTDVSGIVSVEWYNKYLGI